MNRLEYLPTDPACLWTDLHVLLIEDAPDDALLIERALRKGGTVALSQRVDTLDDLHAALEQNAWDVILADYCLPGFTALDALRCVQAYGRDVPFLVISGTVTADEAVTIMRMGAHDYLYKNDLLRLVPAVARELREAQERRRRRDAEAMLQASEERFRLLAERSPDMIFRYRLLPTPAFEYISPAATDITGYTPHEHYADPSLAGSYLCADCERLLAGIDQEPSEPIEAKLTHKDGREVWIELRTTPVRGRDGEVVLFEGIARDITRRKQVEATLARYRLLFETNLDIMLFVGAADGRILEANQAAVNTYGYTRAELLGLRITDLRVPTTVTNLSRQMHEANAGGIRFETEHIDKYGQLIPVEVNSIGTDIAGERVLLSVIRDLRERRASEVLLHLRDSALAAAANGIVIATRDGCISWTNPAFTRLTGYASDDVIGKTPRILRSGFHDDAFYARLWSTVLSGEVWQGELVNRRKDGTTYIEEQTITPLHDATGTITHFIAVKQDVTDRHQREREQAVIAAVARALRTATSRAEMLPVVLAETRRLLNADAATIAFRDPLTDEIVLELGDGAWSTLTGTRLPAGSSATGYVLATGEPYISTDTQADTRFAFPALLHGLRTMLGVPLIAEEQTIGVLWAGFLAPDALAETRPLAAIADIAATAILRATLHEQTLLRLRRLTALRTIDQAISASHDLPATIDLILGQVCLQLEVDAACLLRYIPAQAALIGVGAHGFRTLAPSMLRLAPGMGVAGRALREGRIIALPDADAWPDDPVVRVLREDEQFQACYAVPLIAGGATHGVLEVFHRVPLLCDSEWQAFLETLAGQAAIALDNAALFSGLQQTNAALVAAYDATIEGWSRALDLRDKETEGHSQRVTTLALRLARVMGVPEDDLVYLRWGALLHDIGKMGVPDHILLKPGPLSDEEWIIMRQHPVYARDLLQPIAFLEPALAIPYCHHEKWDGTGYPQGLAGAAIPLAARIFAVVDVYDALTSNRPYRPAWPLPQVRAHLRKGAGAHFDPDVVTAFEQLLDQE